ncbi:hypothetical protein [Kribbella sp. NPDC000426]|uniref:hypothetical protein n=1 Tax=Kribbella sp. NPDC000426 TaxID=3154255 RepID=UPI003322A10A
MTTIKRRTPDSHDFPTRHRTCGGRRAHHGPGCRVLAGTTTSAQYGPPYNHAATGQTLGPAELQNWAGVRIPIDSANDLVITPLRGVNGDQELAGLRLPSDRTHT